MIKTSEELVPNAKLLVVDEVELARLRAAIPRYDFRDPASLAREWENKNEKLRMDDERLQAASRTVVDLVGALAKAETAQRKLEKTLGGAPRAISSKIEAMRDDLADAREREERLTKIVGALKTQISAFLSEGPKSGPTNGELIAAAREREQSMRAAGL